MDNLAQKDKRVETEIARKAAEFFARTIPSRALLTVTGCHIENHGKEATIFISVLPDSELPQVLKQAERLRSDLREYLKETTRLGIIPRVDVLPAPINTEELEAE